MCKVKTINGDMNSKHKKYLIKIIGKLNVSIEKTQLLKYKTSPVQIQIISWIALKKLGTCKREDIPMEVYDNDNNIVTDLPNVLNKWNSELESVYNFCPEPGNFDDEFDSECMNNLDIDNEDYFRELDNDITIDEVSKAINQIHNKKLVGLEICSI